MFSDNLKSDKTTRNVRTDRAVLIGKDPHTSQPWSYFLYKILIPVANSLSCFSASFIA